MMQNNGIIFTSYENDIMQDSRFLLTKREVMDKCALLLEYVSRGLDESGIDLLPAQERLGIVFQESKVSKGDNYHGLPYLVLDYLRYFNKGDVFTYRCMFWWANFYSFSLHIGGRSWQQLRHDITIPADFAVRETYLGKSENAWEYAYAPENFDLITEGNIHELKAGLKARPHIKLSRKIPVTSRPDEVMQQALENYLDFMRLIPR